MFKISSQKTKCHFFINTMQTSCDSCGEKQRGDCVGIGNFETIFTGELTEQQQKQIVQIIKNN